MNAKENLLNNWGR